MERRLPWLTSTVLRPRPLATPGRSIAMRGGLCTAKPVGTAASGSLSSTRTTSAARLLRVLVMPLMSGSGPRRRSVPAVRRDSSRSAASAARQVRHRSDLPRIALGGGGRRCRVHDSRRHRAFSCNCRDVGALDPLARRVLHDLAQRDLGFRDLRDAPVVLAQVVAHLHLVKQRVHPQQCELLPLLDHAAHHGHAVQRVGLQRFLAAVHLGREQRIGLPRFLLEGHRELLVAERLDAGGHRVGLGVELLDGGCSGVTLGLTSRRCWSIHCCSSSWSALQPARAAAAVRRW